MSFSGHQPYEPTATASPRAAILITNDGFFPDIQFADFIATARITDEYRDEIIHHALCEAILEANKPLVDRKSLWLVDYHTLSAVPAGQVGGKHTLIHKYCTAVYAYAKCYLLSEYPTMNRKKEAENVGKESPERCRELLDRFETAIEDLNGYDASTQTFSASNLRMSLI